MWVGGKCRAPAALQSRRDPVPTVQEDGWAPWPGWSGAESIAFTRILSPDRPARTESPHRLRYPSSHLLVVLKLRLYVVKIFCKSWLINCTAHTMGRYCHTVCTVRMAIRTSRGNKWILIIAAVQMSLFWTRSIQSMPPFHFLKMYFNIILSSTPRSSV